MAPSLPRLSVSGIAGSVFKKGKQPSRRAENAESQEDCQERAQTLLRHIECMAEVLKEGTSTIDETWVEDFMQQHQRYIELCTAKNLDLHTIGTSDFLQYVLRHPRVEVVLLRAAEDAAARKLVDDLPELEEFDGCGHSFYEEPGWATLGDDELVAETGEECYSAAPTRAAITADAPSQTLGMLTEEDKKDAKLERRRPASELESEQLTSQVSQHTAHAEESRLAATEQNLRRNDEEEVHFKSEEDQRWHQQSAAEVERELRATSQKHEERQVQDEDSTMSQEERAATLRKTSAWTRRPSYVTTDGAAELEAILARRRRLSTDCVSGLSPRSSWQASCGESLPSETSKAMLSMQAKLAARRLVVEEPCELG